MNSEEEEEGMKRVREKGLCVKVESSNDPLRILMSESSTFA